MQTASEQVLRELLVLRCQRGDEGALAELIHTWEAPLYYYLRRLVEDKEDTWDVLQHTWMRALRDIRSLHEPGSPSVWLYRVARGAAMDHWRSRYARQSAIDETTIQVPNPQDDHIVFEFEESEEDP